MRILYKTYYTLFSDENNINVLSLLLLLKRSVFSRGNDNNNNNNDALLPRHRYYIGQRGGREDILLYDFIHTVSSCIKDVYIRLVLNYTYTQYIPIYL